MPRPMFDSEYLHGLHEPGGESHMLDQGRPGWIVFTEGIGHDPADSGGKDFSPWSNQGLGILCRLNNGYFPDGTLPTPDHYADFARRVANFVAASNGCHIWIIANEMNLAAERPQSASRGLATPQFERTMEPTAGPTAGPTIAPIPERAPTPASTPTSTPTWPPAPSAPTSTPTWPPTSSPTPTPTPTAASAVDLVSADPHGQGGLDRFNVLHPRPAQFSRDLDHGAQNSRDLAGPEAVITPQLYADCFRRCRTAIHALPGHAQDQVLVGAVAPWNNQTAYAGNPSGDWVRYFHDILALLGPGGCDGFTVHTYSHGTDAALVESEARLNAPFQNYHYHFRAYQDFMRTVPTTMRHLPAYITETDQDEPWLDLNSGWVQRAYQEVDGWNRQPSNQQIRALVLYRWPRIDRWFIDGKGGVIDDFRQVIAQGYRWRSVPVTPTPTPVPPTPVPPPGTTLPPSPPPVRGLTLATLLPGDTVATIGPVNFRRSPGTRNKPADDIVALLPGGSALTVLIGPRPLADGIRWRPLRTEFGGQVLEGWMAEAMGAGPLIQPTGRAQPFQVGDRVVNIAGTAVNVRRTPGYLGKSPADILTMLPGGAQAVVTGGPAVEDGLNWWSVTFAGAADAAGEPITGWMADTSPSGSRFLAGARFLPGATTS